MGFRGTRRPDPMDSAPQADFFGSICHHPTCVRVWACSGSKGRGPDHPSTGATDFHFLETKKGNVGGPWLSDLRNFNKSAPLFCVFGGATCLFRELSASSTLQPHVPVDGQFKCYQQEFTLFLNDTVSHSAKKLLFSLCLT